MDRWEFQAEIRERWFQIETSMYKGLSVKIIHKLELLQCWGMCKGLGIRTEHRLDSWGAGTWAVARGRY